MAMGGGGSSDTGAQEEALRQRRILQGKGKVEKAFSGFTPEFYGQRTSAYNQYAIPQLEDQFKAKADELKFALARQYGTTQTSEAAKRQADLAKRYALARATVQEKAMSEATQAQANVEDQRSKIFQVLNQTADPAAASNMALSQASILARPDPFTPLADMFGDVTGGLAAAYGPQGGVSGPQQDYGWTYDPVSGQYKRGSGASRTVTT